MDSATKLEIRYKIHSINNTIDSLNKLVWKFKMVSHLKNLQDEIQSLTESKKGIVHQLDSAKKIFAVIPPYKFNERVDIWGQVTKLKHQYKKINKRHQVLIDEFNDQKEAVEVCLNIHLDDLNLELLHIKANYGLHLIKGYNPYVKSLNSLAGTSFPQITSDEVPNTEFKFFTESQFLGTESENE